MKRKLLSLYLLCFAFTANAQLFMADENDSTVITEYYDGLVWAYQQIDDFVVGMTNYVDKDNYGKNYRIQIFIKNLGDSSVTFDPSLVTSTLFDKKGNMEELKVYTFDGYMKKVKRQQAWAMALTGFSAGLNAGMAGYQTTYTTSYNYGRPYTQVHTTYNYGVASAAKMAAQTQLMILGSIMSSDKKTISQGYLKMTTIHPDDGIIGYMNIKYKKGQQMTVNIPINGNVYSFDWDVEKKKK